MDEPADVAAKTKDKKTKPRKVDAPSRYLGFVIKRYQCIKDFSTLSKPL